MMIPRRLRGLAYLLMICCSTPSVRCEEAGAAQILIKDCYRCLADYDPEKVREGLPDFDVPTAMAVNSSTTLQEKSILNPRTERQMAIAAWIRAWTGIEELHRDRLSWAIIAAQQKMYRAASLHEHEAQRILYHTYTDVTQPAVWANCGTSVDICIEALSAFDMQARPVSLWAGHGDGHVACQILSPVTGTWVFVDPLYDTVMIDKNGQLASLDDLVEETRRHGWGPDRSLWRFAVARPQDLILPHEEQPALDERYGAYLTMEYRTVLSNYMFVVADRWDDTTRINVPLPGVHNPLARGRWRIMSSTLRAPIPERYDEAFWAAFAREYDLSANGRYILAYDDGR